VTDREKCIKCGMCWIFCPDMSYSLRADGYYDWNKDYCKGCGICARECPKDAIQMIAEEE
jgi:pyruvate ferredoxin oxidoreductase delta subunit